MSKKPLSQRFRRYMGCAHLHGALWCRNKGGSGIGLDEIGFGRGGLLGWCQCLGTDFGMEVAHSPVTGRDIEISHQQGFLCSPIVQTVRIVQRLLPALPAPPSPSISLCFLPRPAFSRGFGGDSRQKDLFPGALTLFLGPREGQRGSES